MRNDSARGEGASVSDPVDDEADRDVVASRPQEIGVDRVEQAVGGVAIGLILIEGRDGGSNRLSSDQSTEEPPLAGAGMRQKEVSIERLEYESLTQIVDWSPLGLFGNRPLPLLGRLTCHRGAPHASPHHS